MKDKKYIRTALIWLPSILVAIIFVQNAIGKVFYSNQMDKIIANNAVIVSVGIALFIGTALFLYNKTIILGTSFLALYMTFIVFIHMYKGKPFEIAALIVLGIVLAAYLRKPQLFHPNDSAKA